MRDIKFRAWDKESNKYDRHFNSKYSGYESTYLSYWLNDDSVILEQYTGLKDKNGVEIYEGDIVQRYGLKGVVTYSKTACRFGVKIIFNYSNGEFKRYRIIPLIGAYVIGNIHQNPELLESK